MNSFISSFVSVAVVISTFHVHAATITLDAFASATYNAADFGPPSVPLATNAEGDVLDPTPGQVYEISINLFVSDLGQLPNGNSEGGLASVQFNVELDGVDENTSEPGWNLAQRFVSVRPSPGGVVPLWVDLCGCGENGPLNDISVGVDVEDFPRGHPVNDERQTVGQRMPTLMGKVYVDYLHAPVELRINVTSFEVHNFETSFPGVGTMNGDTLRFVPEPATLLLAAIGTLAMSSHFSRSNPIA